MFQIYLLYNLLFLALKYGIVIIDKNVILEFKIISKLVKKFDKHC